MSFAAYIGRPWRADASGPDAYDCKGLVVAVQREVWGRAVPPLAEPARWLAWRDACRAVGWAPIGNAPRAGDVLLVYGTDGPHVGVFARQLLVLHARSQVVRGRQVGRVCLHALDDMLVSYGRPQVWRHAP